MAQRIAMRTCTIGLGVLCFILPGRETEPAKDKPFIPGSNTAFAMIVGH